MDGEEAYTPRFGETPACFDSATDTRALPPSAHPHSAAPGESKVSPRSPRSSNTDGPASPLSKHQPLLGVPRKQPLKLTPLAKTSE